MSRITRMVSLCGLFGLLMLGVVHSVPAQSSKPALKGLKKDTYVSGAARSRVNEMRDARRPFTNPAEAEANKRDLKELAEFLVFRVTDETYYRPPTVTKTGELRPVPVGTTVQDVIEDLDRYVLKPTPSRKLTTEQGDYIKFFGEAVDTAVKQILPPFAPQYGYSGLGEADNLVGAMRVNAARMLAVAAQSGAPAHAPTITKLLTDPNTRPEVLIYVIQAAENLLSAYDVFALASNEPYRHSLDDVQLYELVKALEGVVTWDRAPWMVKKEAPMDAIPGAPPPPVAPMPEGGAAPAPMPDQPPMPPPAAGAPMPQPGNQLENEQEQPMTAEELKVFHFFRRAAIRAISKCRYPIVIHKNGNDVVRPLWTLARLAVNDPAIPIKTRPDEVAEAVIGLCSYQNLRGVEIDVVLDCIADGIVDFAAAKTDDPDNKSILWRTYLARINAALSQFRQLAPTNATMTRYSQRIATLTDVAVNEVLSPLERTSGGIATRAPNPEALVRWRTSNPVQRLAPFTEAPQLVLKPSPRPR